MTIFACGFPDNELFKSIFESKKLNVFQVTQEKLFEIDGPNKEDIYFVYGEAFSANLLKFLNYFGQFGKKLPLVIYGENYDQSYMEKLFVNKPFTYIKGPCQKKDIIKALTDAIKGKCSHIPYRNYAKDLHSARLNLRALHDVGVALTSERNMDRLLDLILTRIRHLAEADAGSLYLVENGNSLRFKLSQNISLDWSCKQNALMPINRKSIGGYTAAAKETVNILDVYTIPESFPFTFNKSYDKSSGYRTKSMITVPMCNVDGEVLGVVQLINKRKDYENKISGKALEEENIIPFNKHDIELLTGLASQAAVALDNAKLYHDIRNLFEGFVKASIVAIEAKDPCTQGHSERVADLTVALAKAINEEYEGPFANVKFTEKQLLQIRYASLLHDFGKVSVKEEVLTKAKKLLPPEMEELKSRYKLIKEAIEADHYKECLDYIADNGISKYEKIKARMENDLKSRLEETDEILQMIIKSNEPTVLEEGNFQRLTELSHQKYIDHNGHEIPYLTDHEAMLLSIKRGSLSESERLEIESHVRHSYNFLTKIPWTKDLSRVPEIAYSHHEKLNGRGYPNHLTSEEIPFESQMMGVADIFDALTAQDRPYKPALPLQKALSILQMEAKNNALNQDLVDLFERKQVYKCLEA